MKDGCNNMEKNRILRYFDAGQSPEDIAQGMRLTDRIVNSIISHYRPDSGVTETDAKPKAKPKAKKKAKAKETAADDFT